MLFAAFSLALISTLADRVSGHAHMTVPRSRNVEFSCAHCLNSGGTGGVKSNDIYGASNWQLNYPETAENAVRHGLCGAEAGKDSPWITPGPAVATYMQGDSIDITIKVSTHHHGWFEFKICDTSGGGALTQECLNQHKLVRDENDPSISPIDARYPTRYYMIPKCYTEAAFEQTMRYKLPENLFCESCVLQWYWVSANTCHGGGYQGVNFPETFMGPDGSVLRYDDPSDCPAGDGGAVGWYPRLPLSASACDGGPGYPEEFWNCADIVITSSDPSATKKPTTTPAPTVKATTAAPVLSTPKPTVAGGCAARWAQCGGQNWDGATCCEQGFKCEVGNQWYSQCVRDGVTPTSAPAPVSSPTVPPTPLSGECGQDSQLDGVAVNNAGFANTHGKLKLDGVKLVDASGAPVQLLGMSSHGLHWFGQCYTKESIQFLAENWGINVFRAAMYIGEGGYGDSTGSAREAMLAQLKQIVDWCEEIGIYVIIDWHVLTPGDPNAWLDSKGASTGFAIEFWKEMAQTYKNKDHVLYELANEPNGVNWATVKAYHDAVISEIRKIDADTIILAGTPTWSQDIHLAAQNPVAEPYHVMYVFHFYAGTHENLLDRVRDTADKIPLFSTEWGTSQASGNNGPYLDVTGKFLALFEEKGISWAQWSYADKQETSAALTPGACSNKRWDSTSCSGTYVKNWIKRAVLAEQGGGSGPVVDPTLAPTSSTPKPTPNPTESVPETTAEPTPEPTSEPTPEPTAEPTPEPTAEPTPEPTAEPTPEPTPETSQPTEPTPAPTSSQGASCSLLWGQCGGKNWNGPKCCVAGSVCVRGGKWYSQCKVDPNKTCQNVDEQCSSDNKCCDAYRCQVESPQYSRCVRKTLRA